MTIVNVDQAQAWDGHEGDVWTEHADRYDRAGRHLERHLHESEPVRRSDAVLDVGCGTGRLTRWAAHQSVDGPALGLDLSSRMLALARKRSDAEGLTNASYVQGDAQVHPLPPASHDVVLSSFGAMFFGDPVAAFSNIGASLRPGGRLALLVWRSLAQNEWLQVLRSSLAAGRDLPEPPGVGPSPFGLSQPDHVRAVLQGAGFLEVELTAIDEPMDLGDDADDAMDFARTMGIYEGLTHGLDPDVVRSVTEDLHNALQKAETPDGVALDSAAWLITARR